LARLHEHQGKAVLRSAGLATPDGDVATTPEQARDIAKRLGGGCVVKIQAWTTGRASMGGVKLCDTPGQAFAAAERMLQMSVGRFPVEAVLVEKAIRIARELFVSYSIDDEARAPVLLLSASGGTGIEDRAGDVARIACDIEQGPSNRAILEHLHAHDIKGAVADRVAEAVRQAFEAMKAAEARSLEINPLVVTDEGRPVAADCRMTVDEYAVFRHPDLGIEIARELDHPPTVLERIAYQVEESDHRGTFCFAELPHEGGPSGPLIGFHGAGGGGSMMSMDAVTNAGFTLANFCDTSGNPSAAKVYAAARIILSQPGIVGYFGSGSGVASQEQTWSACGLAKAFCEVGLNIPAVIRLGGNSEDRAVEILEDACKGLPGTVKGFKKDDSPAECAAVFKKLVDQAGGATLARTTREIPPFVSAPGVRGFPIDAGTLWIDTENCDAETTSLIVKHGSGLFAEQEGRPVLAVELDELKAKDSELIALEVELRRAGRPVVFVDIPIEWIDDQPD